MFWVVQDNLFNEQAYKTLIEGLERLEVPFEIVKVVPFSHEIIPDINPEGLVYVCGALTLNRVAAKKNWTPGSFINDNFDFNVWKQHVGDQLLNYDSVVCKFGELEKFNDEMFIRPVLDSKTFNGQVIEWNEFVEWRQKVLDLKETYTTLDYDTMVSASTLKNIIAEYRFFVVDGEIVTGSLYRRGGKVIYDNNIDDDVQKYAQSMVNKWKIDRAFVIDIARTDDGLKIIEYNNINSAGFYASDVVKLIGSIEDMKF